MRAQSLRNGGGGGLKSPPKMEGFHPKKGLSDPMDLKGGMLGCPPLTFWLPPPPKKMGQRGQNWGCLGGGRFLCEKCPKMGKNGGVFPYFDEPRLIDPHLYGGGG